LRVRFDEGNLRVRSLTAQGLIIGLFQLGGVGRGGGVGRDLGVGKGLGVGVVLGVGVGVGVGAGAVKAYTLLSAAMYMRPRATMPVVLYECVPGISSFGPPPS
jgi:hypothetical protein